MIRLLPPNIINRIAAGEVIERPAAAIKELVENSLDAGATTIHIFLKEGGQELIQVFDNGAGMSQKDLNLAVERHATSKLLDDALIYISTLGFRGEALPSIGSVSRLTVKSRSKDEETGWKVYIEGGEKHPLTPTPHPIGTTVEIQDLFYATPARLKFLKSPTTETHYIVDMVNRLALSHPYVSFKVETPQKILLDLPAVNEEDFLPRLSQIMGSEFSSNTLSIQAEREGIILNGYISLPTFNRSTAQHQYFFVNKRAIRDKLFTSAVRVGYQDLLAKDRHALVTLFLTIPPEQVDVNVHPAKTEVRFRESGLIRGLIIGTLKTTLKEAGCQVSTTLTTQALGAFKASFPFQPQGHLFGKSSERSTPTVQSDLTWQGPEISQTLATLPLPENASTVLEDHPLGYARAQIFNTYIIAQNAEGLIVVDQHAAHERLVYEKLKAEFLNTQIKRQPLLIPEIVELTSLQLERLLKREAELERLGFKIEPFGSTSLLVREVPTLLGNCNATALIKDLVGEIEEFDQALSLKEKLESICATLSCHGSIRAGRALTIPEMNELLRQMETTPFSSQCSHGRPTYIVLGRTSIEKLFGRR